MACGARYTLAVTSDGRLFAWGDNRYGQCGLPTSSPYYGSSGSGGGGGGSGGDSGGGAGSGSGKEFGKTFGETFGKTFGTSGGGESGGGGRGRFLSKERSKRFLSDAFKFTFKLGDLDGRGNASPRTDLGKREMHEYGGLRGFDVGGRTVLQPTLVRKRVLPRECQFSARTELISLCCMFALLSAVADPAPSLLGNVAYLFRECCVRGRRGGNGGGMYGAYLSSGTCLSSVFGGESRSCAFALLAHLVTKCTDPPPLPSPPLPHQSDTLEHADGPDDEGEVGRDAERVVEGDLRQVGRQRLEVDALRAAPSEGHVEHVRQRRDDGGYVHLVLLGLDGRGRGVRGFGSREGGGELRSTYVTSLLHAWRAITAHLVHAEKPIVSLTRLSRLVL